LRSIFDVPCKITSAHRFLARLPRLLRSKNRLSPNPLIVTTNYDDLVETAFAEEGEPLDVVTYVADGRNECGRFAHTTIRGERIMINLPNEYTRLSLVHNPVLLKIHGALDRSAAENDSFVITEDHYIDFLARGDLSHLVPVTLAAHLRASHFLFLGYSLRDWNLRVILQRIWNEQRLGFNSWAVQLTREQMKVGIEIWQAAIAGDIDRLERLLSSMAAAPSIRFRASAMRQGGSSCLFSLYPDPTDPVTREMAIVTYVARHRTFLNHFMTAGPEQGFKVSYEGWGCLTSIWALVEYSDVTRPPSITDFDMCRELGWNRKER
jgi:hypothetical protein